MDLHAKQRLVGAAIWLMLLVIVVPGWYSNPVNFSPDGEVEKETVSTLPMVEHAYRLPSTGERPLTNGQSKRLQEANVENTSVKNAAISKKTESVAEAKAVVEVIKPQFVDKVSGQQQYEGQWIVRLQAFNNIKQANELASKIEEDYPVYIKYFEKTRVYSVRTGPYISQSKAEKAKQKLDKILRTNGEVRQLPKNS